MNCTVWTRIELIKKKNAKNLKMGIIGWAIRLYAKLILMIIGWSLIGDEYKKIKEEARLVIIFPHTSYWDSIMTMIYKISEPTIFRNTYFLMAPRFFNKYTETLLTRLGCIPATKKDEKNGGGIERITNMLMFKDEFKLALAPKGTIVKSEWRSGYYWLAKGLKAKICIVGLDYEQKRMVISKLYQVDCEKDQLELELKKEAGSIIQINPENEECCRPYDKNKVGVISRWRIIAIFLIIMIIYRYVKG